VFLDAQRPTGRVKVIDNFSGSIKNIALWDDLVKLPINGMPDAPMT